MNGAKSLSTPERLGEWTQLIGRCKRKPTRKRVHALRVSTLRLQAELDLDLAELPHASHEAQAILEFGKQGEKLRKVLGPVRELDVWTGKLERVRASLAQSGDYVPRSTRECIRQLEQFESRLRQTRRRLEKKLIATIEKRKIHLAAAGEIESAVYPGPNRGADAAREVSARFAELVNGFPAFDEENLHEFRKRIKIVRYLAEIHQRDTACAQIAAQMKKLQSAIGEWHDWQALVREVQRGRQNGKDVAELLAAIAAESLETALSTCRSVTDKLRGKDPGLPAASSVSKGPQRAEQVSVGTFRKLA